MRDSASPHQGRFELPGADGLRLLELSLAPARDDTGRLTGVILCAQDLGRHAPELGDLAEKARVWQLLADYSFDWEYWLEPGGRLRWMSPSCERITGHSAGDFHADPGLLERIVHPEDRQEFGRHLRSRLGRRPLKIMQFRLVRPDDEVRWIEHACQAVFWPDGSFAGRLAVNRDLTETRQVERALRESETQFRLLFELATVGMVVIEPETRRLLRVNERLCRILGYEEAELLRMTFNQLTHPDDRDYDLVRYQRAVRQEDTDYFVEKRYLRKDGQVVWALVNATFIRDEKGYPLRALAAVIDITDRRQAEARVRDLAAVVECSADFIGIAALDHRGIYLNQAGKRLVGIDRDVDAQDLTIEDFFVPEDRPLLAERIMPALERTGRWSGELRFRHFRTGEPIAVYYDALRIDDAETGRPLQYATVTRDIRKEKAAEEALLEADRRKDHFLAMLGHELRNPMAPIRNAVEIIRSIGIGEDSRIAWAMEVLDRQTAHMGRLLDDLLDVSRIVRDQIELEWREVELRDVVQQAVDGVLGTVQERHQSFRYELPASDVRVQGDPVRLSQVLLNILVNAAKYTPEHGEIRVESELVADEILIRVRDNGQGMTASQIEHLFGRSVQWEPSGGHPSRGRASEDDAPESHAPEHAGIDEGFHWAAALPGLEPGPGSTPSATPPGGLGLGLTIAKRLVELHRGGLEAFSEGPGRGAEVRLRLPVLNRSSLDVQHEQSTKTASSGCDEALKVLLVDDNPDVLHALALLLEIHGYEVKTASSGPEALELVRQYVPRVAFLDIGLPGMDGLELAQRLREQQPDPERLLLVALTGLGNERIRERSRAAGFDEHLVKPLDQQTLFALLNRLC